MNLQGFGNGTDDVNLSKGREMTPTESMDLLVYKNNH